ncbi:hypothetical protein [Leadbettera azotonutricia]|uniref:Uncharacterized protein n=1 Tax=Leadbettera azotonutricia (strain ATCC BAA-888 / DSM 13862 / ZAS-9) TaxID=545695 RepID=F5Y9M7_LEAAZ|nr:hypothetical protein [Leadbettera azotonutricia]AEF80276.1 hypothetical protein TREAZ_0804 [Leadbettera azotonutricia ZAS-9]
MVDAINNLIPGMMYHIKTAFTDHDGCEHFPGSAVDEWYYMGMYLSGTMVTLYVDNSGYIENYQNISGIRFDLNSAKERVIAENFTDYIKPVLPPDLVDTSSAKKWYSTQLTVEPDIVYRNELQELDERIAVLEGIGQTQLNFLANALIQGAISAPTVLSPIFAKRASRVISPCMIVLMRPLYCAFFPSSITVCIGDTQAI